MTGYIEIERLQLNGRHGVLPQERVVGNRFELWITLRYDMSQAAQSDSIDCAVDYAEAVEIAKREMSIPSALLENVAWRIREALCEHFPQVTGGRVRVAKVTPPIVCQVESVSATIEW